MLLWLLAKQLLGVLVEEDEKMMKESDDVVKSRIGIGRLVMLLPSSY